MENNFKHTPGPWFNHEDYESVFVSTSSDVKKGKVIVSLTEVDGESLSGSLGEDRANAKLIAAAPELLEALQMSLIELRGAYSVTEWSSDRMEQHAANNIKKIEVAIKKATE